MSWWWGFALGACVGDNITNSPDSNISFSHMGRIWGIRTIKTVVVACLMSEHIRTYEEKISFNFEYDFNYFFDSFTCIVASSSP